MQRKFWRVNFGGMKNIDDILNEVDPKQTAHSKIGDGFLCLVLNKHIITKNFIKNSQGKWVYVGNNKSSK